MRQMRRFKQLLSKEDCLEILERGTHGVMAIMADDDFPYAVPINYYYNEELNRIYFHGANKGMRWDYMMERPKVSFCVVDMDQNDPENYSTNFRSVICYGTARVVERTVRRDCHRHRILYRQGSHRACAGQKIRSGINQKNCPKGQFFFY